jgi:chemotaxis protein methyltransferase CheR
MTAELFASPIERVEAKLLLEGIYQVYGYDFRQYSFPSVTRRILYRMRSEGLKTISALQDRILRDPSVWSRLFLDLCIPVTEMFRDPDFFAAIRISVVPELRKLDKIRIWHAGCSTGEEVYALAILMKEENLFDRCSIYATDLHEDWLAIAKRGAYPVDRMQHYTRNYILSGGYRPFSDYYTVCDKYAVFEPELRNPITFARHNLAGDGSFNEFHLILCRNVLIYFQPELQQSVIQLFRKSLSRGGFLGLGSRDGISPYSGRPSHGWQPFDPKHRIYQYIEQDGD